MADFLDSSYELRPGRRKKIQPVGYPDLTAEQAVDLVYAFLHDKGLHRPEISIPTNDGIAGSDGDKHELWLKLQNAEWFSTSVAAFDKDDSHRVTLLTAKPNIKDGGSGKIMAMFQIYDKADTADRDALMGRLAAAVGLA